MSVSFQSMTDDLRLNSFKIVNFIGGIFLVLFPSSIVILHDVHGVVIALSFILALILYLNRNGNLSIDLVEKHFFMSVIGMTMAVIIVSAYAGIDEMILKKLFKYVYLLLVIPVYFLFRTIKVNFGLVWYGLFVGAVVSALYGINQTMRDPVFDAVFVWRAEGVTNPIIYGDIALLLGTMCLAGSGWFKSKSKWLVILPILAVVMGLVASALSHSRGGWVAIPILLITFIWYSRSHLSKFTQFVSLLAIVAVIVTIYYIPQTRIESKLDISIANVQMYFESDVESQYRNTSIGIRLEAWKAAWFVFLDNPLIGVGWGNLQENAKIYVDEGVLSQSAITYSHPHNQFLSVMASGGIVASIAVFFLFFIPTREFYRSVRSSELSVDARRIALAGLLLMIGFFIFNLSESFLERSRTVSFFIFYLAVFMAGIRQKNTNITGS